MKKILIIMCTGVLLLVSLMGYSNNQKDKLIIDAKEEIKEEVKKETEVEFDITKIRTDFTDKDAFINGENFKNKELSNYGEIQLYLGKPLKEKISEEINCVSKELTYDGIEVTLNFYDKFDDNYDKDFYKNPSKDTVCDCWEITSDKYILSNGIKIGKTIDEIFNDLKLENDLDFYLEEKESLDGYNSLKGKNFSKTMRLRGYDTKKYKKTIRLFFNSENILESIEMFSFW